MNWSKQELKKLQSAYDKKPAWVTNNELAIRLSSQLGRSSESIRWQLRLLQKPVTVQPPKILLLDIETLFIEAKVWGVWNQNIQPNQIIKDWSIVCWAAKWLFSDEVYGEAVKPKEAINRKEDSILGSIWSLMNEADAIVTHNGNNFDLKRLNTKFLLAGMPKPHQYKSIDTLEVAKKNFDFTYNKMGWINQLLGIGTKIETSFRWWDEVSKGSQKYLDKMLEYNMNDVNVLEELYMKLRPWITGHLNMNVYSVHGDISICPTCGSVDLVWDNTYSTPLGLYRAFRCQDCGSIGRSTKKQYKLKSADVQN